MYYIQLLVFRLKNVLNMVDYVLFLNEINNGGMLVVVETLFVGLIAILYMNICSETKKRSLKIEH